MVTLKPSDPRIHSTHFTEEPLELVVPASHKQHEWTDLQRLGFISHPDGEAMATRLLSRKYPTHPRHSRDPLQGIYQPNQPHSRACRKRARIYGYTAIRPQSL